MGEGGGKVADSRKQVRIGESGGRRQGDRKQLRTG